MKREKTSISANYVVCVFFCLFDCKYLLVAIHLRSCWNASKTTMLRVLNTTKIKRENPLMTTLNAIPHIGVTTTITCNGAYHAVVIVFGTDTHIQNLKGQSITYVHIFQKSCLIIRYQSLIPSLRNLSSKRFLTKMSHPFFHEIKLIWKIFTCFVCLFLVLYMYLSYRSGHNKEG